MRRFYHPGIFLDTDKERVYVIEIPTLPGKQYAEVMFMGDLHIGHRDFAPRFLAKYLTFVKSVPQRRIILMGDMFEHEEGTPYIKEQIMDFRQQVEEFIKFFTPVAKQVIAMVYGNHDERYCKATASGVDLLDYLRLKIGNPDIAIAPPQRGLVLVLKVKKSLGDGYFTYPIYVLHSSTASIVNLETQFRRTADNFDVGLIAHGHTHKIFWKENTKFIVMEDESGEYRRAVIRQYWLSTGSFLRFPSYGETKSYPIPDMGAPIVRFYANRHAVEYIDPRTTYNLDQQPYSEEFRAVIETIQNVKAEEVSQEISNLVCPECGSFKVGSKGTEWICKVCGKRWVKNPRRKIRNEERSRDNSEISDL